MGRPDLHQAPAFADTVEATPMRKGSQAAGDRRERSGACERSIKAVPKPEIEARTSFFLAAGNAQAERYVRYRDGAAAFLHAS